MADSSKTTTGMTEAAIRAEIAELEGKLDNQDPQEIISRHIKLLHEYNEVKDIAQVILGKLAGVKQTTVRQLHEDYGLSSDD